MGNLPGKLYTVNIGAVSDSTQHLYSWVQEAIDNAEPNTVILLMGGEHSGDTAGKIKLKASLRFIGINGAKIVSVMEGGCSDVNLRKYNL